MSLKIKTLSGLRWTGFSSVILNILRIVQISVLARFLSKTDFGIVAIVMIVIMFVQMFLDLGIGPAIIHKQSLTEDELSSLYWLNIFIGLFLFSMIFLCAPFIALFYHNPKISFYIRIVAFSLIIQSVGKQFYTLFEKELKFNVIAKIQIFSSFVNVILSIIMAIIGFKILAIIIPAMIYSFLNSFFLCVIGIKEFYKPKFFFDFNKIKFFLKFGVTLTIGGFINYMNSKFDEILIGRLLGNSDLGLYSVSKNLVQKPVEIINPIITRVTFPAMSKIQNDNNKIRDVYLKTINYVATINFFIYSIIFVFSDVIVRIVLGNKWSGAIAIVKILSIYFMINSTGRPIGTLVLSKGKPHYSMYWNLGLFFLIPITIYISSYYGLIGISYGWVFLMLILMIPNWYFLVRPLCGAGFVEYFKQLLVPGVFSGFIILSYDVFKDFVNIGQIYFVALFLIFILTVFIMYNWIVNREFLKTFIELLTP